MPIPQSGDYIFHADPVDLAINAASGDESPEFVTTTLFAGSLIDDHVYLFFERHYTDPLERVSNEVRVYKYPLTGGDPVSHVVLAETTRFTVTSIDSKGPRYQGAAFKNRNDSDNIWYAISINLTSGLNAVSYRIWDENGAVHTFTDAASSTTRDFLTARSDASLPVVGFRDTVYDARLQLSRFQTVPIPYDPRCQGFHVTTRPAGQGVNHDFMFRSVWLGDSTDGGRQRDRLSLGILQHIEGASGAGTTIRVNVDLTALINCTDMDSGVGLYLLGVDLTTGDLGRTIIALNQQGAIVRDGSEAIGDELDALYRNPPDGGGVTPQISAPAIGVDRVDVSGSFQDRIVVIAPVGDLAREALSVPESNKSLGRFLYYGAAGTAPPPPPNAVPVITTSVQTYNMPIYTGSGITVGTFTATDADEDDTIAWSLTGADASTFTIGASTGVLQTNAELAAGTTYNLNVVASDGEDMAALAIQVIVAPNIAPEIVTTNQQYTLRYNPTLGTEVVDIQALDADGDRDTATFTLSGPNASLFRINPANGVITTAVAITTAGLYRITATITDRAGASDSISLEITVLEEGANNPPRYVTTQTTYVLIRPVVGTVVARINVIDDDGDSLAYQLIGRFHPLFVIDNAGVIRVQLPLIRGREYDFSVRVTDGEDMVDLALLVRVFDNTPPVFLTNVLMYRVRADALLGTYITRIVGADPDGDRLTYGLTGPQASNFDIDSANGDLSVNAPLVAGTAYPVTVTVTDGTAMATLDITINAQAFTSPVALGDRAQLDGLNQLREGFDVVTPLSNTTFGTVKHRNIEAVRQTSVGLGNRFYSESDLDDRFNEVQITPVFRIPDIAIGDVLFLHDLTATEDLPVVHWQVTGIASVADSYTQVLICDGYPRPI